MVKKSLNSKVLVACVILVSQSLKAQEPTRDEKIQNYINAYNGNYDEARIKADAASFGVSSEEIEKAKGKASSNEQNAPGSTQITSSSPITGTQELSREEKVQNYINAYNGNYDEARIKADAANYGVSNDEIAMALKKAEAPSQVELQQYTPISASGVLSSDQTKQLAEKYKSEFGYYPSPGAVEMFASWTVSGKNSFNEILNSISKRPFTQTDSINYRQAINSGIDPQVYLTAITLDRLGKLDWMQILNSKDPNTALRLANKQLLNSPSASPQEIKKQLEIQSPYRQDAVAGNFSIDMTTKTFRVLDSAGQWLQGFNLSSSGILEAAYKYGLTFDGEFQKSLNSLADQLDKKGIKYLPGELYPGTGSDAGVNLRDIAKGGTGTPLDVGNMKDAKSQAAYSKHYWGAKDSDAVVVGPIKSAAEYNYVLDSLNINKINNSSLTRSYAPLPGKDGMIRNYLVSRGETGSWYTTQNEAQEFQVKNGGIIYDLSGIPNPANNQTAYYEAIKKRYPDLYVKTIAAASPFNKSDFAKIPKLLVGKNFLRSQALSSSSSKTIKLTHLPQVGTLSNLENCQFDLVNDAGGFSVEKSNSEIKSRALNKEKKLQKNCMNLKTVNASVSSRVKLLVDYTKDLATTSKEIYDHEYEINEHEKMRLSRPEKTTTKGFQVGNIAIVDKSILQKRLETIISLSMKTESYAHYYKKIKDSESESNTIRIGHLNDSFSRQPASSFLDVKEGKNSDVLSEQISVLENKSQLKKYSPNEDDSIFLRIHKAYVRSYKKLK